ncbi:MAG: protein-export chaperone SecB [Gammaproteobacteria bacterium]|nr:protein-export chaperone SecB [Gammaproteobacteria bacterium]
MSSEPPNPGAATSAPRVGNLAIQKVYVKDFSFEAPNAPRIFLEQWKPSVDIQLANEATPVEGDMHEVVLTVTVTVRFEDKTVYLVEVQQAGLFNISGFPPEHYAALVATVCPNILFPFAREAVSDAVTRGGFPQLLLAPVNFEHLYAQELRRRQQEDSAAKSGQAH